MSFNKRRSQRYPLKRPVHVSFGHQPMAFGTLTDISKDGLGFRSRQTLSIGTVYAVSVGEFGTLWCRIVNHSNIDRYGAVFRISESRKQRLERQILETVAAENWAHPALLTKNYNRPETKISGYQ